MNNIEIFSKYKILYFYLIKLKYIILQNYYKLAIT